jgi:hypothetical protein
MSATVALLGLGTTASGAAAGRPPKRQTTSQAQITLLHARRALAALSTTLVDAHTGLVLTNTRAVCKGIGRIEHGEYLRFRCVISHDRARFLVAYVAFGQNGRVLKKIARLDRVKARPHGILILRAGRRLA